MDRVQSILPLSFSDAAVQEKHNSALRAFSETLSSLELDDYDKGVCASHLTYAHEEDLVILYHIGLNCFRGMLAPRDNTELSQCFFLKTNIGYTYAYYKTFIQMLSSVDAPSSHGLFDIPVHAMYLETLIPLWGRWYNPRTT